MVDAKPLLMDISMQQFLSANQLPKPLHYEASQFEIYGPVY